MAINSMLTTSASLNSCFCGEIMRLRKRCLFYSATQA